MSSVADFASMSLQRHVAPLGSGLNVKDRITKAARRLGWSVSRTKDVWYADPRVSISAEELRVIEEAACVKYGRAEVRTIEELISKADALLDGPEADFYRPLVDGFRAFIRALDRT